MSDLEQLTADVEDGLQTELDYAGPMTVEGFRNYLDGLISEIPGVGSIPLENTHGKEISVSGAGFEGIHLVLTLS